MSEVRDQVEQTPQKIFLSVVTQFPEQKTPPTHLELLKSDRYVVAAEKWQDIQERILHWYPGGKSMEGNYGLVIPVWDEHLQQTVAVKFFHPQRIAGWLRATDAREKDFPHKLKEVDHGQTIGPYDLAGFYDEMRRVAQLKHPNIAKVYDVVAQGMQFPISGSRSVERYVPGYVVEWLSPLTPWMDIKDVCEMGIQIASALDYAHTQGVIHCDVTWGNIMKRDQSVSPGMRYALTDFGSAIGEDERSPIAATPIYLDPDILQKNGNPNLLERLDQHGLAVTLYQLLGGDIHEPFDDNYTSEIPRRGCHYFASQKLKPLPSNIPQSVKEVLDKATAADRADRHASCSEFVKKLNAALVTR